MQGAPSRAKRSSWKERGLGMEEGANCQRANRPKAGGEVQSWAVPLVREGLCQLAKLNYVITKPTGVK